MFTPDCRLAAGAPSLARIVCELLALGPPLSRYSMVLRSLDLFTDFAVRFSKIVTSVRAMRCDQGPFGNARMRLVLGWICSKVHSLVSPRYSFLSDTAWMNMLLRAWNHLQASQAHPGHSYPSDIFILRVVIII